MPDPEPAIAPDFSDLLTSQDDFAVCVKCAKKSKDTEAPRVDLLFLRFKEASPDKHGLAELVCHQVVNYALPGRKVKELLSKQQAGTLDLSLQSKLIAEAKRAFIAYDSQAKGPRANLRYAEIGEVIAFCVASHFLSSGQVAAKMALKTNSEMPMFGLDGVHVRAEPDGKPRHSRESPRRHRHNGPTNGSLESQASQERLHSRGQPYPYTASHKRKHGDCGRGQCHFH